MAWFAVNSWFSLLNSAVTADSGAVSMPATTHARDVVCKCNKENQPLTIHKVIELLTNEILTLRPATLQDKRKIFDWLTNSNLTSEMLGPPKFADNPVPTWNEFDKDYSDNYFDNSQPNNGQCFVIEHNAQAIGQINYNPIEPETKCTEIDIWLSDLQFTGKGFGTEAIRILCCYLDKSFGCKTFFIAPSRRNEKAIKSYKKAGFIEIKKIPDNFIPDYEDSVLMIKSYEKDISTQQNA